jgi:diadenylate cyclase
LETLVDYLNRVANNNPWWVVVIELFFLGLVVYWVVDFLEGTRGERLFRGVILILVAGVLILNLVGERLGFLRLQYLYKGFLIAVLIIAVAAFQPEIRRVLIQIGQPRLLSSSSQLLSRTREEIITAVTELSTARIGAIIVIEGQVALGEFIETGVQLDAKVTSELIKTIFYPGTPLHDMAVIIRGDRIISARVQLPLSEAGVIKRAKEQSTNILPTDITELGSRHRAAIGITSGSDCSCIVVSEQTGTISIAESGKLNFNVSESDLRDHLLSIFSDVVSPSFSGFLDRLLRRHA